MKLVKCDRKCQSNKDGFCIGMPCFLGKEVEEVINESRRNIQRDNTSKTEKYYCVLQNPLVEYHDTKVIYGSLPEIVKRKITAQLKKWALGISTVTSEEASKIIETRKPKGMFYLLDNGVHVGIDNRTGDAWTEDFKSKAACSKWLRS